MTTIIQRSHHAPPARRRPPSHNPLVAPMLLFVAVVIAAGGYVGFVLWPRWPEAPVARDASALPIVVADTVFNIEPAAIRAAVQRRPGTQERVDLDYMWPSLTPPDPAAKPTFDTLTANDRLFVSIASGADTLPLAERVWSIYPRYLTERVSAGPAGLTMRSFRDDTAYAGEDLAFDADAPEHFFARCARQGVTNGGTCLLERRIGQTDITFRFPRDWLADWRKVAAGIDRLMARLHPG
jgi:hypothetical protein